MRVATTVMVAMVYAGGSSLALANQQQAIPASVSDFQSILSQSKWQVSDPEGKAGNKTEFAKHGDFSNLVSEYFYVNPATQALVFTMKGYKNRSELRILENFDTSLQDTFHALSADVLPVLPRQSMVHSPKDHDAMTFLQVHNSGTQTDRQGTGDGYIPHPLLRVVYEAERQGQQDHYWAIIKNNANNCDVIKSTKLKSSCYQDYLQVDLGPIDLKQPTHFDIRVGDSSLVVMVNGEVKVNQDIAYWQPLMSYFKAGVYNQFENGGSEVHFYSLNYTKGTS